jgi:hypothetical protein
MWEPRRLTTLWASTACYRNSFPFFLWNLSTLLWLRPCLEKHPSPALDVETTKKYDMLQSVFHWQAVVDTVFSPCGS